MHLRDHASPNTHLLGDPTGRAKLETPALVLDLDALQRNIERMAAFAAANGIALRPHLKAHKSIEIARLQQTAGARGFCCATIGEAEVMIGGGITEILITSPIVTDGKIQRALELLSAAPQLTLVVDNPANVSRISELAGQAGVTINLLVDVDPGLQRTGAATQRAAIDLCRRVHASPNVRFAGLQCYAGQVQHIPDKEARQEAALAVLGSLRVLCEELKAAGIAPGIVSGSGTGAYQVDAQAGVLTELQVGSYAIMDNQYSQLWLAAGEPPPFEAALFVQSTVISNNHAAHVTCDAGFKHFAVDGGRPVVARGASRSSEYEYFGDVHGRLAAADAKKQPPLGSRIEFIVTHCDPTVNLYDEYHCVRGDELAAIWRVDARGV